MKRYLLFFAAAVCMGWGCNSAPQQPGAAPEKAAGASGPTDWALLPFVKVDSVNPVLAPGSNTFTDPIWKKNVAWEEKDVFNPAVVVKNGKIYMLYRAQDRIGKPGGTSRIGLAESGDGYHFTRRPGSVLFPENHGVKGDFHLGRALAASGCPTGYVAAARGVTNTPWTLRGLVRTMFRSRRGAMALASGADAAAQAALSAAVVGGFEAAVVAWRWSAALAALCLAPLAGYVTHVARDVWVLRRRGFGDHRRELPAFLALDLLGRGIKVWAYAERVTGRAVPYTFRGERAGERGSATPRRAA